MKKTKKLRTLLERKEISFLMEAHNGLSAKIAEETGFDGIWGSGLSISASLGVRDNNEASWTQVLEVVEFMSDATQVPILLDGDTGYGNFNNMRRLVRKLEQRGIAGVCIEDKIFPKTNSFLRGEAQPLADMDEFCGKIKAGLDSRTDDDFCIVARVEALIAGWGLKEALKRAEAYRKAGATAILMHSKKSQADEIFAFMKEWGDRSPVVIVPTKYYATPTEEFVNHGVSTVIWANHLMRSAVSAMQATAKTIFEEKSLVNVEEKIASVKEVFRLQNDHELEEAEKKYFQTEAGTRAVILAASRGSELGDLTLHKPKALLEVNGVPLLKQSMDKMKEMGIQDITVVRGYKKESFPEYPCSYVDNNEYESTGELYSLYLAKDKISNDLWISYGDIAFKKHLLSQLQESKHEISILVDTQIEKRSKDYVGDYVLTTHENQKSMFSEDPKLLDIDLCSQKDCKFKIYGEWIGMMKSTPAGSQKIMLSLESLSKKEDFRKMKISDLFRELIQNDVSIGVSTIQGHWMDIDHFQDFERVQVF